MRIDKVMAQSRDNQGREGEVEGIRAQYVLQ